MLDSRGFRTNVGIVLLNNSYQVLWAKCTDKNIWQFPQGGINENESPIDAMYRELYEEIGLKPNEVKVLTQTRNWLSYYLPEKLIRYNTSSEQLCVGQTQKWFLLKLCASDRHITLDSAEHQEFECFNWVSYWYPLGNVVFFKRDVYRQVLKEFALTLC